MKRVLGFLVLICCSLTARAEFNRLEDVQIGTDGRFYSLPPAQIKSIQVIDKSGRQVQKTSATCAFGNSAEAVARGWPLADTVSWILKNQPGQFDDAVLVCIPKESLQLASGLDFRNSYDNKADGFIHQQAPGSKKGVPMPRHYLFMAKAHERDGYTFFVVMPGRSWE